MKTTNIFYICYLYYNISLNNYNENPKTSQKNAR